jgi:hypothetical protein
MECKLQRRKDSWMLLGSGGWLTPLGLSGKPPYSGQRGSLPVLIPVAVPVTAKCHGQSDGQSDAVLPIMAVAIVAIVAIVVIAMIVAVAGGENVRDSHILFLSSVPRIALLGKILDVPLRGALLVTRPLWTALRDRGRGYTDDVDPRFGIAPGGVGGPRRVARYGHDHRVKVGPAGICGRGLSAHAGSLGV